MHALTRVAAGIQALLNALVRDLNPPRTGGSAPVVAPAAAATRKRTAGAAFDLPALSGSALVSSRSAPSPAQPPARLGRRAPPAPGPALAATRAAAPAAVSPQVSVLLGEIRDAVRALTAVLAPALVPPNVSSLCLWGASLANVCLLGWQ